MAQLSGGRSTLLVFRNGIDFLVPDNISHFRVIKKLGEGGMGEAMVYLGIGNKNKTMESLEKADQERNELFALPQGRPILGWHAIRSKICRFSAWR